MTNEQKKQVQDALMRYVRKFETQSGAAASLDGVSSATISHIKNNNWDILSDRMWNNIARQVGFYCGDWQTADTNAYLLLRILFSDAQQYAMTYGIAMAEGLGKTYTAGQYIREHENTYYIAGTEELNRSSFMKILLTSTGISTKGTVPEMLQLFTDYMKGMEASLLIVDDAHLLKDRVLHLLVMLANSISGSAGIVLIGGEKLRTRILDGISQQRQGFEELYKSIGSRFITLLSPGPRDVELVCRANGIVKEELLQQIVEDSQNNLHKASRLITQYSAYDIAA
jgi:DNA transposition AAA+ family ATPase